MGPYSAPFIFIGVMVPLRVTVVRAAGVFGGRGGTPARSAPGLVRSIGFSLDRPASGLSLRCCAEDDRLELGLIASSTGKVVMERVGT